MILIAGLVAGTLDIITACLHFYINTKKDPTIVLKFIASGIFGRSQAFSSGNLMIWLGLLFHYIIAFAFSAFFVFLFLKWKWVTRRIIWKGILYGVFVWVVMNWVVVPLSNASTQPFNWKGAITSALILIVMVGIPIAVITKGFYGERRGTNRPFRLHPGR